MEEEEMVWMATTLFDNAATIMAVQQGILPHLLTTGRSRPLRLWSVGLQSGDEAHMLALLLANQIGEDSTSWRMKIFATDADPEVVSQARHYVYPNGNLTQEPMSTYSHLLYIDQENARLKPELRSVLTFAPHSLIRHAPFPHLDLVLCHTDLSPFSFAQQ